MVGLPITKMHGLGNSFVVVDDPTGNIGKSFDYSKLAVALSDKRYGVGSDGILVHNVDTQESINVMRIFNPDGSEAKCVVMAYAASFGISMTIIMQPRL